MVRVAVASTARCHRLVRRRAALRASRCPSVSTPKSGVVSAVCVWPPGRIANWRPCMWWLRWCPVTVLWSGNLISTAPFLARL